MARVVDEASQGAEERVRAEAEATSDSGEPPECRGQKHHIISRRIAKQLNEHETLHDYYKARDPRFVSRAVDEKAHCGYQSWHRDVDDEVVNWLINRRQATREEFEAFLREIYTRPAMRARFPNGF